MKSTNGKLQLVIRSEKRTRIVEFDVPLMTPYGKVGASKRRARVYDYVLDDGQARAVTEARKLASRVGLVLEVTDLSRESTLKRMVRIGLRGVSPEAAELGPLEIPSIALDGCQDVTLPAVQP